MSMHEHIASNDLLAMERLVARDPRSVNETNEAGLPPLYTAALYREQRSIDFLIEHEAVVDIFACAYLGKVDLAEELLTDNPALVHATATGGMTALHFAARTGHHDVAALLLRHDADVNARDDRGRTALIEACHGGPWKPHADEKIVQLLLDNNAQVDLFAAAATGRTDLVESALAAEATRIDAVNGEGKTALFIAAENNHLAAVKRLVERGADVNRCDAVGTAALHRTSQQCSDELIQYLIEQGADAHLCCYAACGDVEGTRAALDRDPEAANEIYYEYNAVGFAIHSWQLDTLRVLVQHGCRLSDEDRKHILRISNDDESLLDELLRL